jgi:hypothetical protein
VSWLAGQWVAGCMWCECIVEEDTASFQRQFR